MKSLPEEIDEVIKTLAQVLRSRGSNLYVDILEHANIDIRKTSYDNWNGGTYGYTLTLQIPIPLYGNIQDDLEKTENDILNKIKPLTRSYDNEYIESIIINPKSNNDFSQEIFEDINAEIAVETIRFWINGYFRLFLSHASQNKMIASTLQKELYKYAISVFVAHEDIEPTKEWQNEIELALSTMDALATILTENFCESKWCDQEVGVAIGRKVLVIPIRAGIDPYGFIGKFQGISARDKSLDILSEEIFETLLRNESTKQRLTSAIVNKLAYSQSFSESRETLRLLELVKDNLTIEMIKNLEEACKSNRQVYNAFGVTEKIRYITKV